MLSAALYCSLPGCDAVTITASGDVAIPVTSPSAETVAILLLDE